MASLEESITFFVKASTLTIGKEWKLTHPTTGMKFKEERSPTTTNSGYFERDYTDD